MAERDSKGRFLPKGGSGDTMADDVAGLGTSLGVTGTAADDLLGMLSTFNPVTTKAGDGLNGLTKALATFNPLAGGAGMLAENLSSNFGDWLSSLDPLQIAIDAVVAVVTTLATALYNAAAAAIALTQEKDALRDTFDVFTGGGGDALLSGLEDLAATLPFTADKLNAWAKSLLGAGIQGEALNDSIRAISAATAIMGDKGGQAAMGLIKRFAMMAETGQKVKLDRRILAQLAEAGVSAKALATALGVSPDKLGGMAIAADKLGDAMKNALISKGAKALATMGQTWASISAKLTEGWEDAFEDLGDIVGPFMAQVRSLASEFFAGSAAGGTFKDVIKGVLTPAFEIATRVVRAMHIAYLYALIAFLRARIFLAPLIDALGSVGVSGKIVWVVMYLIAGVAIIAAVAFGVLALAVFLVALPFIIAAIAITLVVMGIKKLVGAIGEGVSSLGGIRGAVQSTADSVSLSIRNMVTSAANSLLSFPLVAAQAGANFVLGLTQAIMTGQGPVAEAVKGLARSAIAAITGAFQTKSPSRLTAKIGGYFTQGLAGGIDDGSGDVEGAAQGAGDAAIGGVSKGMRKGGGKAGGKGDSGGRSFSPTFNNCTFGSVNEETFREWMAVWWEEQDASGPEPEPA